MQLQSSQLREALRSCLGDELGQRPDVGIAVRLREESDGVTLGKHAVLLVLERHGGRYLVDSGLEMSVGLVHQGVADVHANLGSVACGNDRQPSTIRAVLDLQPPCGVLEEQRNEAEVGVRVTALELAGLELLRGQGRVVLDAKLVDARLHARRDGPLGQVQAKLNGCQNFAGQRLTGGQEDALHPGVETGYGGIRWPWRRVINVAVAGTIKVFLFLER